MNFDQGEFDFDRPGNEAGYERWRERLDQQRRDFEKRWGVPLGHRVHLRLRDHARSVTGRIEVTDLRASPPRFRIGSIEFTADEIESVVRND